MTGTRLTVVSMGSPVIKTLARRPWHAAVALGVAFSLRAQSAKPEPATSDDLYKVGQQLFDQYAPPEVKEQYDFPSKAQWDSFALKLQRALDGNSLEDVVALEPEARAALAATETLPGLETVSDWLRSKIEEIDTAKRWLALPKALSQAPVRPAPSVPGVERSQIPLYEVWLSKERARPVPEAAAALMPRLREAFVAEGVPQELAWIAEVESQLNPRAESPSGARGLFQFMPDTAHSLGLSTFLPDDRTNPDKAAHAAAKLLKVLYAKFGNWPLSIAAYNAGEGRVSRLLASRGARDFAGVAPGLSVETRMYVPKVCALVSVRTGRSAEGLSAPRL